MEPPIASYSVGDHWYGNRNRFSRFGLWRAEVVNNEDPENRGRLQVRVLHLHPPSVQTPAKTVREEAVKVDADNQPQGPLGEFGVEVQPGSSPVVGVPATACPWAEPCLAFGGRKTYNSGFFALPYVGSTVWVAFEMGFSGTPVWLGCWLGKDEIPEEAISNPADVKLIRTEVGHILLFDETPGMEKVKLGIDPNTGDRIRFLEISDGDETVTLQNGELNSGTRLYMTEDEVIISQGNTSSGTIVKLTSNSIDIHAAGDISLGPGATQGVCLDSLITVITAAYGIFNAHTHGGVTAGGANTAGPSSPMVPPVIGVNSSNTVKAKL